VRPFEDLLSLGKKNCLGMRDQDSRPRMTGLVIVPTASATIRERLGTPSDFA
jgi:hypothetical protein